MKAIDESNKKIYFSKVILNQKIDKFGSAT